MTFEETMRKGDEKIDKALKEYHRKDRKIRIRMIRFCREPLTPKKEI